MPQPEHSERFLIINTKAIYHVKRLIYEITKAPTVWQHLIETIFFNFPITYDNVEMSSSHKKQIKSFPKLCEENSIILNKINVKTCKKNLHLNNLLLDTYS